MNNRKNKYFNLLYKKAHHSKDLAGWFWKKVNVLYSEYILGCDIKYMTRIGEGFVIAHASHGSVVSPSAIIGTGAVVVKDVSADAVVTGNPAKVI